MIFVFFEKAFLARFSKKIEIRKWKVKFLECFPLRNVLSSKKIKWKYPNSSVGPCQIPIIELCSKNNEWFLVFSIYFIDIIDTEIKHSKDRHILSFNKKIQDIRDPEKQL